jgi:hypothetical protein
VTTATAWRHALVLLTSTKENPMNEQETHKKETDKHEALKQETNKIVELTAEETDQVVGGNARYERVAFRDK